MAKWLFLFSFYFLFPHIIYANGLIDFVDKAGAFLSDFSSSKGDNCDDDRKNYNFKQACSNFYRENLTNDLKDGSAFSIRTKIASPAKVCDSIDIILGNAQDPQQVYDLFNSNGSNENNIEKFSCFSEVDQLKVDKKTKDKIKKNLAAEHLINLKRLENGSKNYLTEIATIDSLLGNKINSGVDCKSISKQEKVSSRCRSLKNRCRPSGGLGQLVKATEQALDDLKKLNNITTGTYSTRSSEEQKKVEDLKALIQKGNPLLQGDQFKKKIRSGTSVKEALTHQLRENRKKVLEDIKKNEKAVTCLGGGNKKQCKNVNEIIASNPEIKPFKINTNSANRLKEKDKIATNHYLNKVQCFSEIRQLKKTQKKDINDLAINAGLTILTGGSSAVLGGGLKFAALATRATAYGSKAPKLKAFSDFVKTPLGATKVSIWGADAAFASYEFTGAAKACDKKLGELTKIKEPTSANYCPSSLSSPSYNIKSDYKSCFIEVGLASLGLLPFAPELIGSLVNGRSIRALISKSNFSKEQINNIVKLQKNIDEKQLSSLLEDLSRLNSKDSSQLLDVLGKFDGKSSEFSSFVGNSIQSLSKKGKFADPLPDEIIQLAAAYKANLGDVSKNTLSQSNSASAVDDDNSLEGKYVDLRLGDKAISGEVKKVYIANGKQRVEVVRADGKVVLINAKEVTAIRAQKIDKKSRKLDKSEFRDSNNKVNSSALFGKQVSFIDANGNKVEGKVVSYNASGTIKVAFDGQVESYSRLDNLKNLEAYDISYKEIKAPSVGEPSSPIPTDKKPNVSQADKASSRPANQKQATNNKSTPPPTDKSIKDNQALNQQRGYLDEGGRYNSNLKGQDVEIVSKSGRTKVKGKVVSISDIDGYQRIEVRQENGDPILVTAKKIGILNTKNKPNKTGSKQKPSAKAKKGKPSIISRIRRGRTTKPQQTSELTQQKRANKAANKRLGLVNYRGKYKKNVFTNRHVSILDSEGKKSSGVITSEKVVGRKKYYTLLDKNGVERSVEANKIATINVNKHVRSNQEVPSSEFNIKGFIDGSKTVGKFIKYKDANNNSFEGYIQGFEPSSGEGIITVINNGVKSKVPLKDLSEFELHEARLAKLERGDLAKSKQEKRKINRAVSQKERQMKKTARKAASAQRRSRLPFFRRGLKIKKDSLNGKKVSLEVKSDTGLIITGKVVRELDYQGQRVLEVLADNGAITQVLVSDVKKVNPLKDNTYTPVVTTRLVTGDTSFNQTVTTALIGTDRRSEVKQVFSDVKGVQLPTGAMTQNSRSFVLPNGEVKSFTVLNSDQAKGEITDITKKLGKPLDKGYYTYVVLEDGSISVGKVNDSLEFGAKHANIAAGRNVKIAGELKVGAKGEYHFNVSSGTFTRQIAKQFGGDTKANEFLADRAGQALQKYLGKGVNKEDGSSFFDDLPDAKLTKYCNVTMFRKLNPEICELGK